jgi:hypothetical protein
VTHAATHLAFGGAQLFRIDAEIGLAMWTLGKH